MVKLKTLPYFLSLHKLLCRAYMLMLLINVLAMTSIYLIHNKGLLAALAYGFFYEIIWGLFPSIALSTSLFIYNKKSQTLSKKIRQRHFRIAMLSLISFLLFLFHFLTLTLLNKG